MLSVAGGKLTTYRRIALDALEQLGVRNLNRAPRPLPGATGLEHDRLAGRARRGDAHHLLHLYGSLARGGARARASTTRRCSSRSSPAAPTCARRTLYARDARVGAHRRGRPAPADDRLAARVRVGSEHASEVLTRLTQPLVRDDGELRAATWDEALDRAAAGFRRALDEGAMTGLFSCSKATNELNFAAQKFSRVALRSNNVDSCNRT